MTSQSPDSSGFTLQEFEAHAKEHFPEEFQALPPFRKYRFADFYVPIGKDGEYREGVSGRMQQVVVLHVGTTRTNRKVWARATGTTVNYYVDHDDKSNSRGIQSSLKYLGDTGASLSLWTYPFDRIRPGGQSGGDTNTKMRARRMVFIHYLFMLRGELEKVDKMKLVNHKTGTETFHRPINTDPLKLFEKACQDFFRETDLPDTPKQRKKKAETKMSLSQAVDDPERHESFLAEDIAPTTQMQTRSNSRRKKSMSHHSPVDLSREELSPDAEEDSLVSVPAPNLRPTSASSPPVHSTLDVQTPGILGEGYHGGSQVDLVGSPYTTDGQNTSATPASTQTPINQHITPLTTSGDTSPAKINSNGKRSNDGTDQNGPPRKRPNLFETPRLVGPSVVEATINPITFRAHELLVKFNQDVMDHISQVETELTEERRLRAMAQADSQFQEKERVLLKEQADKHKTELEEFKVKYSALEDLNWATDNGPQQEMADLEQENADLNLEIIEADNKAKDAQEQAKRAQEDAKTAQEDAMLAKREAEEWKQKHDDMVKWKEEADNKEKENEELKKRHATLKADFMTYMDKKY